MGGRGGSIGGSHGMQPAVKAAAPAAKMTPGQALVARLKNDPTAILKMSDDDAVAAFKEIAAQKVGSHEANTFVQRYLNTIGWAQQKPEVLNPAAYDAAKAATGAVDLYHADHDGIAANGSSIRGMACTKQYLNGATMYGSNGIYGSGTYWAAQSASKSAEFGDVQIKGFLNSKSKTVHLKKLQSLVYDFEISHPKAYDYLRWNTKRGYGGAKEVYYSIIAASHGYNTILAHGSLQPDKYVVTLDRSATTVCSSIKTGATYGMKNW